MTTPKKPFFGQTFHATPSPAAPISFKVSLPGGGTSVEDPLPEAQPLPEDAEACNTLGNQRLLSHQPAQALRAYDRAIALKPEYVDPHFNRSNALLRLHRAPEALAALDQVIALAPALALAHYNRGTVLQGLNRDTEAANSYRTVLELEPDHAQARFNLGCIDLQQKNYEAVLAGMDRLIAKAPHIPEAHNNRGVALLKMGLLGDAIASFTRALGVRADYADAYNNRAEALIRQGKYDAALVDLQRAVGLQSQRVEPRHLLGRALRGLKRHHEAASHFQWVFERAPEMPFVWGDGVQSRLAGCDWRHLDEDMGRLTQALAQGKPVAEPFVVLGLSDDPMLQKTAAQALVREAFPSEPLAGTFIQKASSDKLRVGYYSADFHGHATANLMARLFEEHDRERFEWIAFSFGPDIQDAMRQRLVAGFDRFIDVRDQRDVDIARMSREMGIDIAVDLKGFTLDNRFGVFVHRCAPVQVSYLGYPGTTGAPCMDYVIADGVVIPPEHQAGFTEKVVYLPHSYQVNDPQRQISDRVFTREELGLPAAGFVFCCFNNNYKILPPVFDCWMRILQAVPHSVLWLLEDNAEVPANLRREAQARGVAPDRLVFAPRMPLGEHLARQRMAGLFLDTLPVNAHTTASDALWAGLPVVTCQGKAFAARVASSLLTAVGLPELVTQNAQEYEALAIALALDAPRLEKLRSKLRQQIAHSPLFDARLFARHLEAAYTEMHRRRIEGLAPDVIRV